MKIALAEKMSRALMDAYGLEDWDFGFDRATSRLGATHTGAKKITLSKRFVKLNGWKEVQETMFHEIAHAITGEGHNKVWKEVYKSIGGNPSRDYSTLVSPRKHKPIIRGHCPNCKRRAYARIRSRVACRNCCIDYNNNQFSEKYLIVWEGK